MLRIVDYITSHDDMINK